MIRYEKFAANIGKQNKSLPFGRIKQNVNALPHGFLLMGRCDFAYIRNKKRNFEVVQVLADEKPIFQTLQTKKSEAGDIY